MRSECDTPIAAGASNWLQYGAGYSYADARAGGRLIDNGLTVVGGLSSSPWSAEPTIFQAGNGVYPQYLDNLSLRDSIGSDFTSPNQAGIDLTVMPGTSLTRNWGGGSGPWGRSWTTDPISIQSRNSLGLETSNTAEFVSYGTLMNLPDYKVVRPSLGLGGMSAVSDDPDGWFLKGFMLPK